MTTPASDTPHAAPSWKPLDPRQRRVLGVLIEKAKTTPAGYPMSVLAIVTGCNQKNNRDPLTAYDDSDVEEALRQLCALGAVSELDWLGRVPKYKHHAYEWLGVSRPESAVMTELLLRGAQALGDLRGRAARMEPIADLAALKPIVDALLERGLMVELTSAGRGQVVSHNLHPAQELAELRSRYAGDGTRAIPPSGHDSAPSYPAAALPHQGGLSLARDTPAPGAPAPSLAELAAEVAELRAEVTRLRDVVRDLESGRDPARS
jgi:uncharacterized protein YceH (UPF0502 family)